MIECRDLALGHLPDFKVGGSWIPVEPNGTRLPHLRHPTLLGRAHIGMGVHQ